MTHVKQEDRQQALHSMQFVGRRPSVVDEATKEWLEKGTGVHATPEMKTRAYQFAVARERGFAEGIRASGGRMPEEPEPEWTEGNPMGTRKV